MTAPSFAAYSDPSWYTPHDLPAEVLAHDARIGSLDVGSAGKTGILDLEFAPVEGKTKLVRQFRKSPLYLFHPVYIDEHRPDMAFVYLLQAGDGFVQGDRYRLELDCARNAAVHITTQAPTKLYRAEENFATQILNLRAAAGAFVEYLPDPVIPFRGSRFYQKATVTVDPEATMIFGETLLPGRVARGEAHAYTFYYTDFEARTPQGMLLFADRLNLRPDDASPRSPGVLGANDVFSTLYIISHELPAHDLSTRVQAALDEHAEVTAGVSTLPNDCGVIVRILGTEAMRVERATHAVWSEAHLALTGLPSPEVRK